jgi:hypothetical protein
MTDAAPSLRLSRPDAPEALEQVYERMLAKEPAQRLGSMSEVIASLEMLVPREPAAALAARIPPHTLPRRVPSPALSSSGRLRGTDAGWSTLPKGGARGSRIVWAALGFMLLTGSVLATIAVRQRIAASSTSSSSEPPPMDSSVAVSAPSPPTAAETATASAAAPPVIETAMPSASAAPASRPAPRTAPRNQPPAPATGLPRRF